MAEPVYNGAADIVIDTAEIRELTDKQIYKKAEAVEIIYKRLNDYLKQHN
jgi:hypothetical protein